MSYYLFGIIEAANTHEVIPLDFWWVPYSVAVKQRLCLLLGVNLPQKAVNEMLLSIGYNYNSSFPFLLVNTPLENTSDSLISPSHFGVDYAKSIGESMNRVQNWLNETLNYDEIFKVHLLMTEGFDNRFERHECAASGFLITFMDIIDTRAEVPSLHFVLT